MSKFASCRAMRIDRNSCQKPASRLLTAALLFSLAIAAPALSAQGVNRASAPTGQAAPVSPTPDVKTENTAIAIPLKPDSAPTTKEEAAKDAGKEASKEGAKEPGKEPAKEAAKIDDKPAPHIALILPGASKSLGKVADAVKQGFLAGANADGKNAPPFRIYAADDETGSLTTQYRKAMNDGAVTVIGGVTRDGANALVKLAGFVPTLALNAPSSVGDFEMPDRFFHISLNLDWEARLAARAAFGDGLRHVAVVASKSPLAKRIQDVFEREFTSQGGEVSGRILVNGDDSDSVRVPKGLNDATADSIFVAAEAKVARLVRPYFPQGTPVFATSLTVDPRANVVENLDLDTVRFMEMPWFVQPDHPAVMAYSKPVEALPIEYERLYALGIDAWRLAQLIGKSTKAKDIPALDGVTGRITLDGHQFVRMLAAVEMRDGRATLSKPAE